MEWGDLPFFLAVARTGQIARAASMIDTDPTTVGRRIRRLEAALGERLFEQGPNGQTLTAAGSALLDRAQEMARIAAEIGESDDGQALHGSLRISVAEGFGTWFISRHLHRFAEHHPRLEIDLVANSGFLSPTRRETDVAVLLARPRRGPLITRKLTDYRLNLYAARAYLAGRAPIASAADLIGHRLIGYIPDIIYAPELRYLEELPIPIAAQLRSSSINAQHGLIAASGGIGVLPRFIGGSDPSLAIVLPALTITRSFWLTAHRETHQFAPVRRFSEWLVALVGQQRALLIGD